MFQSLTRNPLGSPDIIGFSTGSYTGALIVTTLAGAVFLPTAVGALAGGLGTALIVYLLAYRGGVQGFRLIITGIAVTAVLHGVNTFLLLKAGTEVAMAASIWGAGSLALAAGTARCPPSSPSSCSRRRSCCSPRRCGSSSSATTPLGPTACGPSRRASRC